MTLRLCAGRLMITEVDKHSGTARRRVVRSLMSERAPDFVAIPAATFSLIGKVASPRGLYDGVCSRLVWPGESAVETASPT